MKNESKQLEIISNQLSKALDIVIAQKKRYEALQSAKYGHEWTCEEDGLENEFAIEIMGAIGSIEGAHENVYCL